MDFNNLLFQAFAWIKANLKLVFGLVVAVLLLLNARSILATIALLALIFKATYWIFPEVRPFWDISFDYLILGFKALF